MPYKEKPIEKRYFTIGEIAEELNIYTSTIRFWEKLLPIKPKNTYKNGARKYSREDFDKVRKAHDLIKVQRFTIEGARMRISKSSHD